MCGRFTQLRSWADLMRLYRATESAPASNWPPRYNVAPTQDIAVVRRTPDGGRRLEPMRWGLVPSWAKDVSIGSRMINARAETLADKPSFRTALRHRRCLIPADGFYEWRKQASGGKQPFRISWPQDVTLAFAGLWERWEKAANGEPLHSCTIVTVAANDAVRPLHDRMPALLDPDTQAQWLGETAGSVDPLTVLRPFAADQLTIYPVDRFVNVATHEGPRCIEHLRIGAPPGTGG
jgi:putative SOS response-associated peptidase YedK